MWRSIQKAWQNCYKNAEHSISMKTREKALNMSTIQVLDKLIIQNTHVLNVIIILSQLSIENRSHDANWQVYNLCFQSVVV